MRSKSRFNSAPGVGTVVDAGCWTLLWWMWTPECDARRGSAGGGTGVRRAAYPGHPPTVAVAAALWELRGKYASIKYLTTF